MRLDTDFIRFSREMKPTKQCKISQKNLRSDQRGGAVAPPPPPPKYATDSRPMFSLSLCCVSIYGGLVNNGQELGVRSLPVSVSVSVTAETEQ